MNFGINLKVYVCEGGGIIHTFMTCKTFFLLACALLYIYKKKPVFFCSKASFLFVKCLKIILSKSKASSCFSKYRINLSILNKLHRDSLAYSHFPYSPPKPCIILHSDI